MEAASKRGAIMAARVGRRDHREKGKVVPVVDEEDVVEPYVMVVDDSSVNRAVVTELLRSLQYRGLIDLLFLILLTRILFSFLTSSIHYIG